MAQGALDGLRLIELGQLIAGPFCGQLMADHGAEVIKIEPPAKPGDVAEGDPMRQWGRGKPLWFPVVARNKKTITLNLRDPRGQDLLKKLVKKSDFLLENFRPGTLEKWGLGYGASADNPGLIMIRVSGYGQTGPYAPAPAMAPSARRWAASATSPEIRARRPAGSAFPSAIRWLPPSHASAPSWRSTTATAQGRARLSIRRSTKPCSP
jgi:crotonobetainyl-CoA:carnitine CoA-transferase CaiB-like acyl-CoA transferase